MKTMQQMGVGVACVVLLCLAACQTQEVKSKDAIALYQKVTAGEWVSEHGAVLVIAPVRSRMVTDESIYIERTDEKGTFGRLIALDWSKEKKKIIQSALAFTQEGQWRNLRETPELFTALLPKDVKPAGTCDIQPAPDANSISYSCGGSAPEIFRRKSS
jgi:hypothetical protein